MKVKFDEGTFDVDDLTDQWVLLHGPTLNSQILGDAPFGYWRTISGADASGNNRPLTPYNTPTAGASLDLSSVDASITLDGSNNLWDSTKRTAFNLTGDLSLSLLLNATDTTASDVARKGDWYGIYLHADGTVRAFITNSGLTTVTVTGPAISADTTYHVGMSYNGALVKLYVNGTLEGSAAQTGAVGVFTDNAFTIGQAGVFAGPYTGRIDEVALFDRALSAARFQAHYEGSIYAGP